MCVCVCMCVCLCIFVFVCACSAEGVVWPNMCFKDIILKTIQHCVSYTSASRDYVGMLRIKKLLSTIMK